MASRGGGHVLSDAQWAVLEPLVMMVRPRGKTPHEDLHSSAGTARHRRTLEAIIWRHLERRDVAGCAR